MRTLKQTNASIKYLVANNLPMTNNEDYLNIAEQVAAIKNQGRSDKYVSEKFPFLLVDFRHGQRRGKSLSTFISKLKKIGNNISKFDKININELNFEALYNMVKSKGPEQQHTVSNNYSGGTHHYHYTNNEEKIADLEAKIAKQAAVIAKQAELIAVYSSI